MSRTAIKNLMQKEMSRKEFLAFLAFATASVFGIVGLVKQLSSHAATPTATDEPETGTITAPATKVADDTASGGSAVKFGTSTPSSSPPVDTFTLGVSKPVLINPDLPTASDTVGAAYGWNGVTLDVLNGDQTIPANTTWSNKLIHGYVNFTDQSSRLINSVVDGRAPGGTFRAGLANGNNGGYMERVTLRATATSATNYLNGLNTSGGVWTLNRCDISRVVDSVHVSSPGTGSVVALGCKMHDYSFWDNDSTHSTDTYHPYWSHADVGIQRLGGNANADHYEGCSIQGYFDVTGVIWSNGVWGSGTASGGSIGTPATALNGGYPERNYSNLISYTNSAPYTGMTFINNWLDGGSYPSGMVQMTVAGNHSFRLEGNRFGLGGQPGGGSNRIYLCSYAATSTVDFGAQPNVYDTIANVPVSLRGKPLTFTATGANIVPGNF